MMELIKDASNKKIEAVKKLQTFDLPLVMYGAGSYAVDVARFLTKYNITITAACVDSAYFKSGQTLLGTIPVVSLEDALQKYDKCNVVIGFNDFIKANKTLTKLGNKNETFFIDAPNHLEFFDYAYIKKHQKEFEDTYAMLEDQKSKDIFVAFVNSKIAGDPTPLYKFADFNQYFSEPVQLTDKEVFVDCGAYDGDTVRSLIKNTDGKYNKIFSFEPDEENYKKLKAYIKKEQVKNIETINAGAWSEKTVLQFSSEGNTAAIVESGGDFSVAVDTIDNVVKDEPVTYIKMDIEGAELEALKGAKQTITKNHPKLAICAYHKPDDLTALPEYIKKLNPNYKLYLRHHQYMSWEMVLYALPK